MLTAYSRPVADSGGPLVPGHDGDLADALWIDLRDPSADERRAVEAVLGVELPSRQEAEEIEVSSRLYVERGTLFMIATVMLAAGSHQPSTTPVTFAYQARRLVTVRYADPTPFRTYPRKLARQPAAGASAQKLLLGLVDEVIDRAADVLEAIAADLTRLSDEVFSRPKAPHAGVDFTDVLARIGVNGLRAANARESMVSLSRILAFYAEAIRTVGDGPLDEHWRAVGKDVASLTDHATFLSSKVGFALDATLGRINNEQNQIIKQFSVLAVVFLPPTLIASIYGMNFTGMPELSWSLGYPLSLLLMVASAIAPYLIFRRKGWL